MIDVAEKPLCGLKFIDLFAGIGGFHYAMESFGAECVYASEWDVAAADTYRINHRCDVDGDITKVNEANVPSHDILCGGFPCQAFSISGKQRGFDDTRGTLFFDIARIVAHHHPRVLFMENVKNLLRHDGGRTFGIVLRTLSDLGYTTFFKVLNSGNFGVPQHRERVYIVSFRNDVPRGAAFQFPQMQKPSALFEILEDNPQEVKVIARHDIQIYKSLLDISDIPYDSRRRLPNRPLQIGIVNKGGQGERIYDPAGHSITLSAYGGGAGAKTGLYLIDGKVRKLTPRECARLQGFPEDFIIPQNHQQAYKQFGNSVTINVLQYIAEEIAKSIGR